MNNIRHILIFGVFILLIQMLISGYVNIWPMLYIAVYPILLISMPYTINRYITLVAAFCIGFLIDIITDGVVGLNAAAFVAMGYFRPYILRLIVNKNTLENIGEITEYSIGLPKLALYTALCYCIFFAVYILMDSIGWSSPLNAIIRFMTNVIVNSTILILLWKTIFIHFRLMK